MTDVISPPTDMHGVDAPQGHAGLTAEQYRQLIQPLHQSRVGRNAKGFSHVEAWDVRRTLIRIFGFGGFDVETLSLEQVAQIESPPGSIKYDGGATNEKSRWTVVYRAQVRLIIKDRYGREIAHFDDGATGDSINQVTLGDAHDNALKTCLSQALKRCAVNAGDQFGLSLYNGGGGRADDQGYHRPVVIRSLVAPPADADAEAAPVIDQAADGPVLPEPGPAAPVSGPPDDDGEYCAPIGAGDRPLVREPTPARPSTRDTARRAEPPATPVSGPPTPPAEPATPPAEPATPPAAPAASPDQVFDAGVRAIAQAGSSAALDQLDKLVDNFQAARKITDGQAGRLRLRLGARRDELAQADQPGGPPALADDTDGAVIGSPA